MSGYDIYPALGLFGNTRQGTGIFLLDDFNYTPPSGFNALDSGESESVRRIIIRGVRR